MFSPQVPHLHHSTTILQRSLNGETYTFTVESYLFDKDSNVYTSVKELEIDNKIDLGGFLYWYEGENPYITSMTEAK